MSIDATIATWKLTKQQVTSTEKLFLLTCADRAGENGVCWPSIKRICADTCLDRKTVIDARQSVIEKGLMEYTGDMIGKTKLIPIMRLTYVIERHSEDVNSTENGTDNYLNSTENGTGNGTENGTVKQYRKRDTESIIREPIIRTDH